MIDLTGREGAAGGLRAGLLLLVVLGVVGTALALAYERHWQSAWQLAPWLTLGIVSVAWIALVVRQTAATVWLARAVAIVAIVSAALGVWQHVDANLSGDHAAHDHSDRQEQTASDHDHSHGDASTANDDDDHDHSHGEGTTASDDHHDSDDEEPASSAPSLMDAMSGSAGHAPVPAALSLVPVGLALALATIGLGGTRGPSQG